MYRRTKIAATIGPSCSTRTELQELMNAGVNIFRLNFSHGVQEEKAALIEIIRDLSSQQKSAVAILGDLQGPKIRVGQLRGGSMTLTAEQKVTITSRNLIGTNGIIPTVYRELPQDVIPGSRILLDDGLIELEVLSIEGEDVHCLVCVGGELKDRKGINLPGVKVSAPSLTQKDRDDLFFCIKHEVDYIALSFVRAASDIMELRDLISSSGSSIKTIAKIEKPEAVECFHEIVDVADGIMVARGDLGVEILPEKVPLIQKQIIRQCNLVGKPVITATQMLESMISNPRPTRAETSDVANAILDGTDAVMLSGETAAGAYPREAVELMVRVANDVELDPALSDKKTIPAILQNQKHLLSDAIGQAACRVAECVGAAAILAFTQTGSTAMLVSKHRPSLPIYAVTPKQHVRRSLALYAGVRSLRVDIEGSMEAQIESVDRAVLDAGVLQQGDVVVITMGSPLSGPGTTNMIKVHRLGMPPAEED